MNLVVTGPGVGSEPGVGAAGAENMVLARNANRLSNWSGTSFPRSQAGTQRLFAGSIAISKRETMAGEGNEFDC